MKKRSLLIVFAVILVIVISFATYLGIRHMNNRKSIISLEQLKYENEYQYCYAKWNLSPDEVKKSVPYAIEKDEYWVPASGDRYFYKSKKSVTLDGYKANASFEFTSDKLNCVQFYFRPDEDCEKWFDSLVNELRELYGEESDSMTSSNDQFNNKGYRWDTEQTSLQIVMMTGVSMRPYVIIGVGLR